MNKVTEENFLYEFYEQLFTRLKEQYDPDIFTNLNSDQLFKLIILNNGCAIDDECVYKIETINSLANYEVAYVYGAMGNDINKFYDYIELYGMRRLVIFLDYFNNMYKEEQTAIIGRSTYFDAIQSIVNVLISTCGTCAAELFGSLSTTCASNNYRFAGAFIAASIINNLFGLNEDDVSLIKYDDLMEMLNKIGIKLLLCGIKYI